MSHLFRISSNSNTHLSNSKTQKIVKYKNGYIVQIQRKNGEIEEFFFKKIINSADLIAMKLHQILWEIHLILQV